MTPCILFRCPAEATDPEVQQTQLLCRFLWALQNKDLRLPAYGCQGKSTQVTEHIAAVPEETLVTLVTLLKMDPCFSKSHLNLCSLCPSLLDG